MTWFEQRAGLDGAVAVVTGGAGGLGQAIVADLAANGVRPAVLDLDAEAACALRHPDGGTSASAGWFNWPQEGWADHAPLRLLRDDA
ncbi:hypothetical protein [Nocardia abscessus]|uniref:hypothetical protein n=1 Tax=Nocardia abscessus TaxID=120957 RepID=UPI00030209E3|nr:hypothetical protein [Nocardia abscessus]